VLTVGVTITELPVTFMGCQVKVPPELAVSVTGVVAQTVPALAVICGAFCTATVFEAEVKIPQLPDMAVTEITPAILPPDTEIIFVVEVPVQPPGRVQEYVAAPGMGLTVKTPGEVEHTTEGPEIEGRQ